MRILVFDTETTGLVPKCGGEWPRVVQLSYMYIDTDKDITLFEDSIIKCDIPIPTDSTNIHGITNEISQRNGLDIKDVVLRFSRYLDKTDILVAHNISFDRKMMEKEYERLGYPNYFNVLDFKYYDTMKNGKELCNIYVKSKYGGGKMYKKFPRLTELYTKLFGLNETLFGNAHNAIIDVLMTARCYLRMEHIKHTIDFDNLYKQYTTH